MDRAPVEFGCLPQRTGRDGRRDVEQEDLRARTLQNLYLRIKRGSIRKIECGVGNNHPTPIPEPILQSLEQIPSELVVLPKDGDLPFRIRGLDVVRVDAPLGPGRWLPTHRPGNRLGSSEVVVARRDKELRNLPVI